MVHVTPDFKINIFGMHLVGKTALIHRFNQNRFEEPQPTRSLATTMIKCRKKWYAIWDTAGQEKFRSFSPQYFRYSSAVILVFDLSERVSLDLLENVFLPYALNNTDKDCIKVIVGNKSDLILPSSSSTIELRDRATALSRSVNGLPAHSPAPYFEASALTGHNVSSIFDYIFDRLDPIEILLQDSVEMGRMEPFPSTAALVRLSALLKPEGTVVVEKKEENEKKSNCCSWLFSKFGY